MKKLPIRKMTEKQLNGEEKRIMKAISSGSAIFEDVVRLQKIRNALTVFEHVKDRYKGGSRVR